MSTGTDNVEAFLFELNELMERHKAMIVPNGSLLMVTANGHHASVGQEWKEVNGRWKAMTNRLIMLED